MDNKEIERLLLENLKLSRENREYIIKIDRRQRWARNTRVIYWVILIGLAVGGYYYAFPYLQEFQKTFSETWNTFSTAMLLSPFGSGE